MVLYLSLSHFHPIGVKTKPKKQISQKMKNQKRENRKLKWNKKDNIPPS